MREMKRGPGSCGVSDRFSDRAGCQSLRAGGDQQSHYSKPRKLRQRGETGPPPSFHSTGRTDAGPGSLSRVDRPSRILAGQPTASDWSGTSRDLIFLSALLWRGDEVGKSNRHDDRHGVPLHGHPFLEADMQIARDASARYAGGANDESRGKFAVVRNTPDPRNGGRWSKSSHASGFKGLETLCKRTTETPRPWTIIVEAGFLARGSLRASRLPKIN